MRTIDEVVGFLRATAIAADGGSLPPPVGVFARAYHRITLEIVARIADGFFEDPSWLAEFDVRFAGTYKAAIERPADRAACWRIAFDMAERGTKTPMRHLLLGINAHMRYDLCTVLLGGFVEADKRDARRRDFVAVNRAMKLAIGPIQSILHGAYGEWLERADAFGLGVDELLTYERFADWRGRAWDDAMSIYAGKLTLADVDARVAREAKWIARLPI
ncbi:MAG: hypothetical protein HOV80_29845 [Polyangiaceae bacterium]|nr:hypothetical protein [Polyangiaceae bacterium]